MPRLMAATPPRKLTISNLRVQNWDNAGWAGFNYVMQGTNMMRQPIIFDGRNIYDPAQVREMGFTYYSIGRV